MKAKKSDNAASPTVKGTETKPRQRKLRWHSYIASPSAEGTKAPDLAKIAFAAHMRDEPRRSAERAAWFEANEPPSVYGRRGCSQEYEWEHREELELQQFTVEYLKRKLDWHPAPKTTWSDYAAEAANSSAHAGLRHLRYLVSRKDRRALAAVADIATDATRMLSELSPHAVKRLIPIARRRFHWPFLKAAKERFGDDHKRIVKEIQLGYAVPFSEDGLARIRDHKFTARIATAYLCLLEEYRKPSSPFGPHSKNEWQRSATKLKPFSKSTWEPWFEVLWEAVLADHNGHPECDPELEKIGLYRAEHSTEKYGGTQLVATGKTRKANIQDGIRERLRKAIKGLSELPKKIPKK